MQSRHPDGRSTTRRAGREKLSVFRATGSSSPWRNFLRPVACGLALMVMPLASCAENGDRPGASTAGGTAGASAAGGASDEDPMGPRWDRFHTTAQTHALLEAWAARWPELTELYSIGETLEGTPLMVLEITNEATGPALEKPGYYYDGNIHAGELTGAEVALHFAWYVLSSYGDDPQATRLVDGRALYVRPKFNPDGADIALTSAQTLRSTPRPYDQDGDGLLDEDPPNDLDGDGHITRMRIPNPNGDWFAHPEDPRLMVRRPGRGGGPQGESRSPSPPPAALFYDVESEGIDDDGDGRLNEDGVGGIDMNRNFPRNWGLEFEQSGAGPFPLSEPETHATLQFLSAHRNITGIFHGHTSGGFAYRLPSTTAWESFPPADQALILEESAKYEETTGQPARPSYTDPEVHRHGTLISWGYWDFGVVGFVPEFWGGATFGEDYDGDGRVSELEELRFHDERLDNDYFTDWNAVEHPELGTVEVGGWHSKFVSQNPPTELLQAELELYVPWMLWLAEIAPEIAIRDVTVTQPEGGGEQLYRLRVEVENAGYLPTNLTQRALDAEIAVPVRALVEPRDAELVEGRSRVDVGHLRGERQGGGPGAPTSRSGAVEWLLRATGSRPVVELTVVSEKGGTLRRSVELRR